eukprot:CAMPEP_0196735612 /NCGR_PEP_ID=MMETSP1091-20130531/13989_1 /TAXON_ID=302021 /ORGANISM="Rhodomonas sp., Strain CCMP768" /LENGTH=114 /DNA_ID=CAMNT_0042079265 /DNA_START=221 /DNA_END=565 /DNA_ORIENTATION=+
MTSERCLGSQAASDASCVHRSAEESVEGARFVITADRFLCRIEVQKATAKVCLELSTGSSRLLLSRRPRSGSWLAEKTAAGATSTGNLAAVEFVENLWFARRRALHWIVALLIA